MRVGTSYNLLEYDNLLKRRNEYGIQKRIMVGAN